MRRSAPARRWGEVGYFPLPCGCVVSSIDNVPGRKCEEHSHRDGVVAFKPRIADLERSVPIDGVRGPTLAALLRLARAVKAQRDADPEWHHCDLDEFNVALDETDAAIDAFDWS